MIPRDSMSLQLPYFNIKKEIIMNKINEEEKTDPNALGDLFYMTFAASDNIKSGPDATKTWYLNPGNISTASYITLNPMPWAGKLIEIKATMSPDFDYGVARWAIVKNNAEIDDYLFMPPKESRASRGLDIDFGVNDYVGLSMQLQDVITDTWPSAVLVFKRI